ncbi:MULTISPECIES: amidohydrolase family protein [Protofrankia]|uniref:Amidohydrolase n=1 Tax=Candidatus Protofrankia datiscae TaxID=2716812 RepID=F8AXK7_9ACTN|nr:MULTISPECIES: amidohydrolase family protein [Protofrankia]AEH10358.1 amidohydrolase [Candidatus Protofrankia datiscae]
MRRGDTPSGCLSVLAVVPLRAARALAVGRAPVRYEVGRGVGLRGLIWNGIADTTFDGVVVVGVDGRVAAVGPRDQVALPDGLRMIDCAWIGPGVVDAHVHLPATATPGYDELRSGVVAVRDLGSPIERLTHWRFAVPIMVAGAGPRVVGTPRQRPRPDRADRFGEPVGPAQGAAADRLEARSPNSSRSARRGTAGRIATSRHTLGRHLPGRHGWNRDATDQHLSDQHLSDQYPPGRHVSDYYGPRRHGPDWHGLGQHGLGWHGLNGLNWRGLNWQGAGQQEAGRQGAGRKAQSWHARRGDAVVVVESPAAARGLVADGVDLIKVYVGDAATSADTGRGKRPNWPPLPPAELAVMVEAAHAAGLPVTAHALSVDAVEMALRAGVDELAHVPVEPLPPRTIERIAAAGVPVVSTLQCHAGFGPAPGRNAALLHRAGVTLVYGTDAGGTGSRPPGVDPRELDRLAYAGLGRLGALRAATSVAARAAGLDGRRPSGRVEVGGHAAVVGLPMDPLVEPAAWRHPTVVVNGQRVIIS